MKRHREEGPGKVSPEPGNKKGMGRRDFLAASAAVASALGTTAVAGKAAAAQPGPLNPRTLQKPAADMGDAIAGKARVVHSVCLQCHSFCGVRGVVKDERLESISGNPYHPYNHLFAPLDYTTPVKDSLPTPSSLCGKGMQAMVHTYNPYRVIRPLKRSGPRGSGRFEPIEWDVLMREIAEGGELFAHLGEKRSIQGLRHLDSDDPIQPSDPGLGPRRNGLVLITGRLQSGRKQFINRFVKKSFGSVNRISHTDICGLGFRMGNLALSDGSQKEIKADPLNCEYMLVFGANIYEALQPGINIYGALAAKRRSEGKLKFVVIDPRATMAGGDAEEWLPVKPGQDGALALGMIRWIIENGRYNRSYLEAPNREAAKSLGYPCPSNATHLVIWDPEHERNGQFLRLSDIVPSSGKEGADTFMVWEAEGGNPVPFDQTKAARLDGAGEIRSQSGKGIKVKTAFRILKENAEEHSMDDYARLCGIPRAQMERVAAEFTSHGTKAAVTAYHGAGNYVNGTFAAYAIAVLNVLVGSVDRKGGYMQGGGGAGGWNEGLYDLKGFPGVRKPGGVIISREKAVYEKTTEYREKKAAGGTGYPALRPWFAFSGGGLCVETLSGIDARYPYPCSVLITYLFNPVFSIPGGRRYIETLSDPTRRRSLFPSTRP